MRKPLFNNQIRRNKLRLIDETGEQLGIVSLREALQIAHGRNLDLIQVTEKLEIPVCKLGNYGKYLYQIQKKEKKQFKKTGELKTVRLSFNISSHDIETKAKQAKKFLEKGDKIKVELRLRGRQKRFSNLGREKINELLKSLEKQIQIKIERELKKQPSGLTMIITKVT